MNEEIKHAGSLVKDPASYSAFTYGWVVGLALWGGVVRILREVKLGDKSWKQILGIFAAELAISGFAGVNTFFLCEALGFQQLHTAVMTSISSYMGGRALTVLESIWKAKFSKGGE